MTRQRRTEGDDVAKARKRVLGLACSPRKGGNSDLMLDAALEGASSAGGEIEKVYVADLDIHPCKECNACFKTGTCVQKDDMRDLYSRLLTYECVALASPVFAMALAAQAKIMIDRLQCCWAKKFVLKEHTVEESIRASRRGLWLGVAGMRKDDIFDGSARTVGFFFGMLEIKERDTVTFSGVDDKGAILDVPGALDECRAAGARLVGGVEKREGEKWQSSLS